MKILPAWFALVMLWSSQANALNLQLIADKDISTISNGDIITFTVSLSETEVLSGYTLDIRYDPSELEFISSEQRLSPSSLAQSPPSFLLNPALIGGDAGSQGLQTSSSGRASVLMSENSEPSRELMALVFKIKTPVSDDSLDLEVGFFDAKADAINQKIGQSPLSFDQTSAAVSIGIGNTEIPIPYQAAIVLMVVFGIVGAVKKRMILN